MQEKLVAYWHMIETHLRIVVFALFILMLLIIIYLKNNDGAEALEANATAKTKTDPIPPTDDLVKTIHENIAKTPVPIVKTEFANLITNSMFDVKAIRDAMEQEKSANDKYQQAFLLFNEKKYREAYDLVNQCLKIRQNHLPAKKLLGEIEQILEGVRSARKPDAPAQ